MKNKESIAIVDPVGAKAGMDWYGLQLLRAFSRKGWQACFLSNCNRKDNLVTVINVFNNQNDRGWKSLLKILKGLFTSCRILHKKKIQTVILHIFRSDWLELLFSFVFYLAGFKVCLIIHDIESLDTGKNSTTRKWILSRFHHFKIVHNAFSEQELRKIISGKDAANLHVIPHGDFTEMIEQLKPEAENIQINPFDKTKMNLLFFGQIKKVKGLDLLLKAMQLIGSSFKLTVAGKERDDTIAAYSELIDELKKQGSIEIINRHISDPERDFLFKNCDVIILPYRHIYQSGVLLMAMSYGKTVVASDLPPFQEIIRHGINGFLFQSGSSQSLASVLLQLKQSANTDTGAAARTFVQENYHWNKIADLFVRMLAC